jgi:hypothetical protein
VTRFRRALAAVALAGFAGAPMAAVPGETKRSWPQEKCFRYTRDWNEALRRFGQDGLSAGFVAGNAAFIRSGCAAGGKICPETSKDLKLVDVLAIRVVNEGMSTTFLPFACPDRGRGPLIAPTPPGQSRTEPIEGAAHD